MKLYEYIYTHEYGYSYIRICIPMHITAPDKLFCMRFFVNTDKVIAERRLRYVYYQFKLIKMRTQF